MQRKGHLLNTPDWVLHFAVKALEGVGGDFEWWLWPESRIGHLRVPVTAAEALLIPDGMVVADAGDAGDRRPRTVSL